MSITLEDIWFTPPSRFEDIYLIDGDNFELIEDFVARLYQSGMAIPEIEKRVDELVNENRYQIFLSPEICIEQARSLAEKAEAYHAQQKAKKRSREEEEAEEERAKRRRLGVQSSTSSSDSSDSSDSDSDSE